MHLFSCTNTHHDVTGKSWDSQKYKNYNMRMEHSFSMKQKILNLCLRCHILGSYFFVAEVTFKSRINRHLLTVGSYALIFLCFFFL